MYKSAAITGREKKGQIKCGKRPIINNNNVCKEGVGGGVDSGGGGGGSDSIRKVPA